MYFWRNLLIESGVLLPLFGAIIILRQGQLNRSLAPKLALAMTIILPIWLAFLAWSLKIRA